MSNTDSFIDEVTEEVRRDKLYSMYRKYGWLALLAVVLLVGGAAWNEWRKASLRAEAQAAGDALLAALDDDSPAARAEALSALVLPDDAGRRAIVLLMRAGAEVEAGNTDAAREAFNTVAADEELPDRMRDLAALKSVMLSTADTAPAERIARLETLSVPGRPYRLLALEQIALARIESGERDHALDTLQGILADADVTEDLRRRASQLIVALGGTLAAT